jgi:hypothetical protein
MRPSRAHVTALVAPHERTSSSVDNNEEGVVDYPQQVGQKITHVPTGVLLGCADPNQAPMTGRPSAVFFDLGNDLIDMHLSLSDCRAQISIIRFVCVAV